MIVIYLLDAGAVSAAAPVRDSGNGSIRARVG
jgi:hypothetical protein